MSNTPTLYVIAGCNGSGKSTFSNAVTPSHLKSFDYDKHFLDIYNSLFDWERRDRMAHNTARKRLEEAIDRALSLNQDFCYETNFNSTPTYWPNKFKNAGFRLELIYFCLSSTTEAKRRVQIRIENGGHFVPEKEIEIRFSQGYYNLNNNFQIFDTIHILDSTNYGNSPEHLLSLKNREIVAFTRFPEYLKDLLPSIYHLTQPDKSNF